MLRARPARWTDGPRTASGPGRPPASGPRPRSHSASLPPPATAGQALLGGTINLRLGHQAPAQVAAAAQQGHAQRLARPRPRAAEPGQHTAQQQPHGIGRVDDEDAGAHRRGRPQRPPQLGAVDGERIQQRMGDQGQLDRPEPAYR
ncbi:hypothetical protein G6F53_013609 [Rhizopus delemar]|nr:hypothetical protein G6F53_013609 [Rhizopus delemar]